MIKLGRLEVELVAGTPTKLTLAGRIDDSAAIADLLAKIPPGDIVFDTAGITFVNSIGMREWMRLLRALHWRGDRVSLERVADMLMTQMNLLPEFKQAATITSFHAAYVCASCGAESSPLVEVAGHAAQLAQLQAPKLPCPECGAPMELGDFPERYLSIFQP
jgi:DNA-directed RNA polymerase subunit RPC12/RpoP